MDKDRFLAPLVVLALLLGAGMTLGPTSAQQADEHAHIQGFAFTPDPIEIEVGEAVEWHNHDGAAHTATADNNDWTTGTLSSGTSGTLTFDEPGTWSYHCQFHPSMTATLIVGPPNEPPTVTIDDPSDGDTVDGTIHISGSADDPDGLVDQVQVRVDGGTWQTASGTTGWNLNWDTTEHTNGVTLIEARAFDTQGAISELDDIEVTVDNPLYVDLEITPAGIQSSPADPMDLLVPKAIHVTVENHGNTGSGAFLLELEYEHNGETHSIGATAVGGLPAFSSTTRTLFWDTGAKIGDFPVTATADPDGETGDTDPGNNAATRTVSVVIDGIDGIDPGDPLP